MSLESKELKVQPKEIGITAAALMHILSLEDSKEKITELLKTLNVTHLYTYFKPLKQLLSNKPLTEYQDLINFFEDDTLIFFGRQYDYDDEMIALKQYLDNLYPDNWGVVVYTVEEYITGRSLLGKEDLYNIGGNNIYAG